jgi:uroporphyrinogen III methyltransferase/synthase
MTRAALAREGCVYLVGWEPGANGWSTERARALVAAADLVISDFPVRPDLRELMRPDATLDEASGTSPLRAAMDAARRGQAVVRLFAGDPFADGDGVHEARELEEAGIPFEVTPAVSRLVTDLLRAGIPLSPQALPGPVTMVAAGSRLPPPGAATGSLLVSGEGAVPAALMQQGWPPETPAVLVVPGRGAAPRVMDGELQDLADQAPPAGERCLLLAGAAAREGRLDWLTRRPLHDRGIVVTRPRAQAGLLIDLLESAGARVIEFPTIAVEPVGESAALDRAVEELHRNRWVIFTSVNGVDLFFARLAQRGLDARAFGGARVAAIGPATADALRERGVRPDAVPGRYQAEGLLEILGGEALEGQRILIPRAEKARDILPDTLRSLGAHVEVAVTYRTVRPDTDVNRLRRALDSGEVDAVTFTSSSTVHQFTGMFESGEAVRRLAAGGVAVACIGPITASTARELGYRVDIQADVFTVPHLAAALVRRFAGRRR